MRNFFKNHREWILAGISLILGGVIAGYFVWGVGVLTTIVNKALFFESSEGVDFRFDIEGARALNLP